MSVQPAVGEGSNVHEKIAALRRRVKALETSTTIIDELDGGAITPGSITTGTLVSGSITADDIAAGSITANEIAAGSITANEIATGSLTAGVIAAGAITADKIAAGAITADSIAAGAITAKTIQADAITSAAIAAGSITANHIAAGVINATHIQAESIGATQISAQVISAGHIIAGTITAKEIAANTITANEIAAQTITAGQIAAQTITATHIAAQTITSYEIAAGTIRASNIYAGTITATEIAAQAIVAANIAAGTITSAQIAANTITAGNIAANTITATEINATTLSTLWASAGALSGGTITGGTIQTAASGARVVMDAAGLRGYALDGTTKTFDINSGSGLASFTGTATLSAGSVIPGSTVTGTLPPNTIPMIGGGNTLTNSSFDNTTNYFTGWLAAAGTAASSTSTVHGSGTSAQLTVTSANGQIRTNAADRPKLNTGDTIVASAWVYSTIATSVRIYARTFVDSVTATATDDTGGILFSVPANQWTRVQTTPLVSTINGYMGIVVLGVTVGSVIYVDDTQLEFGQVPTNWGPKADETLPGTVVDSMIASGLSGAKISNGTIVDSAIVGLTASKLAGLIAPVNIPAIGGANLHTNSSFEDQSAAVSSVVNTASVTVAWNTTAANAYHGTKSVQMTATTAGVVVADIAATRTPVVVGKTYTISAYLLGGPALAAGRTFNVSARWINAGGTQVGSDTAGTATAVTAGTWSRLLVTGTAPATAVKVEIRINATGGVVSGDLFYTDAWQVEEGSVPTSYAPAVGEILPGTILDAMVASGISGGKLTPGSVTDTQIGSLTAAKITGTLADTQIAALSASKVTGQLTNTQIAALDAAKLTGTISAANIPALGGGNILRNSSLEGAAGDVSPYWVSSSTYATGGLVLDATVKRGVFGIQSGKFTAAGNNDYMQLLSVLLYPVEANKSYTFSFYVRNTSGGVRAANAYLQWRDGSNATISSQNSGLVSLATDGTWTRVSSSFVAPANAVNVSLFGRIGYTGGVGGTNLVVGEVFNVDDIQFEEGAVASAYAPRPDEILPGSVGTTELAALAVTAAKITANTITAAQIASNTITAAQISAGSITTNEIAANTITASDIAALTITAAEIASGAITTAKLTAGVVTANELAALSVVAGKVAAGAITATEIAANTITAAKIAADTITAAEIASNAITVNELAANSVSAVKIVANTITAAQIAGDTITANEIATNAITATELNAGAVTTAKIFAGAVTANEIAAGAITANKLNVAVGSGNYLTNGGFEDATLAINTTGNVPGWDERNLSNTQRATAQAKSGTSSMLITSSGTGTANVTNYNARGPVTAGEIYTFSFYARNGSGGKTMNARMIFYDAGGSVVNPIAGETDTGATITPATVAGQWTRATITGTAPTGAVSARCCIQILSAVNTDSVYVDEAQLELGKIPTPFTPKTNEILPGTILGNQVAASTITGTNIAGTTITAANIAANAITTNKLLVTVGGGNTLGDSSFESINTLTSWISQNASARVTEPTGVNTHGAGKAIKLTASAAFCGLFTNDLAIHGTTNPGDTMTVSGWIKGVSGKTAQIQARNQALGSGASSTLLLTGAWQRISSTFVVPGGITQMAPFLQITDSANGENYYFDDFQLELGDVLTSWGPKADEILPGTIVANQIGTNQINATNADIGALTASIITATNLKAVMIGAGQLDANQIRAGGITAQSLSVAMPGQTVNLTNGSFTYDSAVGGVPTGWSVSTISGTAATWALQADSVFTKAVRVTSAAATDSQLGQSVTLPSGRHVFSAWVNTGVLTGTGGVYLTGNVTSGTATITPSIVQGSAIGWSLLTCVISAVSSTVTATLGLRFGGAIVGTALVANVQIQSTIGNTLITPNSITTDQLTTTNIDTQGIQANNIATNAIIARTIAAGVITADKMVAGVIGTNLLSASADTNFEGPANTAWPNTPVVAPWGWANSEGNYMTAGAQLQRVPAAYSTPYSGSYIMRITYNAINQGACVTGIKGPASDGGVWKAGKKYTVSMYVTADVTVYGGIFLGNDELPLGDYAYPGGLPFGGGWHRMTATWVPSSDHPVARIFIRADSGATSGTIYVDNVQVEAGGEATMFSALGEGQIVGTQITPSAITTTHIATSSITADKINFRSGGSNMLTDAAFILNTATAQGSSAVPTSWNAYSNPFTSGSALTGFRSTNNPILGYVRVEAATWAGGTARQFGVSQIVQGILAGEAYSLSVYADSNNSRQLVINVNWYSDTTQTTLVSQSNRTFAATTASWVRYGTDTPDQIGAVGAFVAPPGAKSAIVYAWYNGVLTGEISNFLAHIQFEKGEKVTEWTQYVDPTVIDGSTIQGATIRTGPVTGDRVQITTTQGLEVYSGGVRTAQMKGGAGGLDLTAASFTSSVTSQAAAASPDRKIRFLDSSANLIADLSAAYGSFTEYGGTTSRRLQLSVRDTGISNTDALFGVAGSTGSFASYIQATSSSLNPGNNGVNAAGGGNSVLLINGNKRSDVTNGGTFKMRTGALSLTGPPNGTTGDNITITWPGTYMIFCNHTAYNTSSTNYWHLGVRHWLDGVFLGSQDFYAPPGTRVTLQPVMATMYLSAGTHYWWAASGNNTDTTVDDVGSLTFIKIGI